MRKILFISLFIPIITRASLGDDLNDLIDKFFGTPAIELEKENSTPEISAPIIDKKISNKNSDEIKIEILNEESKLAEFEQKIFDTEHNIWAEKSKQTTLENEVFLLDSAISLAITKINNLVENEKKWQKILEKLTYEKSEIKAQIRIFTQEYEKILNKNFIQQEGFGSGENLSILKWLFSDKSVGEILSESRTQKLINSQKKQQLAQLESKKNELEKNERNAAKVFAQIETLKNQVLKEKIIFNEIANAKANVIERSKFTVEEKEIALKEFREQQNQATFFLQNLRIKLNNNNFEIIQDLQKTENKPFDFPLNIPQKITATFHSKNYKNEFGIEHNGVDFFAPQGTPLFAPADGVVSKVASNGFGYSYFIIKHNNDFFTVYGHLSKILVKKGDIIKRGEMIGNTGGTPGARGAGFFTSGPHLHFEVFRGGEFLDPMGFLRK
jgi:murein DD-endopeptidase MepM/ murein hydrolase activator NlpD